MMTQRQRAVRLAAVRRVQMKLNRKALKARRDEDAIAEPLLAVDDVDALDEVADE